MTLTLLRPMLATEAATDQLDAFIADDDYLGEQKWDGHRGMVVTGGGEVRVLNRAGNRRVHAFDRAPFQCFADLPIDMAFDGEVVGDRFIVFDLARFGDAIEADTPYWSDDPDKPGRRQLLEQVFTAWNPPPSVQLSRPAVGVDEKRRLVDAVWEGGREGVVFKHRRGTYEQPSSPNATEGVRSKGWVKIKYTKTVDAFVLRIGDEGHNSATLAVLDPTKDTVEEAVVEIGRASLNGKEHWGVTVGSIVTATYLSFFPEDRRLVQCRLAGDGVRDDKDYSQCLYGQLVLSSKEDLTW